MTDELNHYVILPHWNKPQMLMFASEAGWTLPLHQETNALAIIQVMQDRFGVSVTVLGEAYDNFSKRQSESESFVFLLDNHSPEWTLPEEARWIAREELPELTLAVPEQRTVFETWFLDAISENIPPERIPWSQRGWFGTASSWIQTQLVALNYTLTGSIKQVYVSLTSCVLCAPTIHGNIYFKACPSVFKYEPLLTQKISELLPAYSPRVLLIDNEWHWMLMEDAGVSLRKLMLEKHDLQHWEQMLPVFARFQMASIPHIAKFRAAGCPDRSLASIPALFEALLADSSTLLVGQENGVSISEMEQLQALKPQILIFCTELASYTIPQTLHHDDLTANNIALNEHGYVFFDWAESGITHPFCSLLILLRVAKYIFEFGVDELDHLRDIYLAEWTDYQPMECLQKAFELAQRLAILNRCLTWHYVITHMEERTRAGFEDTVAYWLRLFLHNGNEPDE